MSQQQAQNQLATHARTVSMTPVQSQQLQQVQQAQQNAQGTGCNWYDVGCMLNASFAPLAQLGTFLGPLWNWLTNPVRLVKMVGGILLIGVALVLLIKPESVPTPIRKVLP